MDKAFEVIKNLPRYKDVLSILSLWSKDAGGCGMIGEEEKIALLVDELEDIRCDNFDTDTDEDKTLKEAIKLIKASKQEPKIGHWIQTNEFFINKDGQFIYKFICSECKSLSYFRKSNKKAIGANVCPNCGTKMQSR